MVKSVLSTYHAGLRDWFLQRLTALVMIFYTALLVSYFCKHPHADYASWHALFTHIGMKIATLLVLLSLLIHAWIGMWTILTDYIKPFVLRLVLHCLVLLTLFIYFFAGLLTVWGV